MLQSWTRLGEKATESGKHAQVQFVDHALRELRVGWSRGHWMAFQGGSQV
jgi:uncharacterized protein (DUF1810 family)